MAAIGSPFGDAKKPAEAAKSAAGFAQNVRKIIMAIKAIRMAATSATGVGALVNAALLLKDKIQKYRKQIAAAVAGAVGLYLYLLYLAFLKMLGALAGAAFGAVTGLPLLAIPGAGPFLYAGWVGGWAVKGFLDPTGTIQLATHPWEAITKPFNWIKNEFGNFGGGIKGGAEYATSGTGHVISGAVGATTNFAMGVVSSIWNGVAAAGGGVWGAFSSGISAAAGAFTASGGAIATGLATVGAAGTGITLVLASGLGIMSIETAYSTVDLDQSEAFGPSVQPGDNDFFTIQKTAEPSTLGSPGANVTFRIKLTAKDKAITSVVLEDNFRFQNSGAETPLIAPALSCPTLPILPFTSCETSFNFNTFLIPTDSLLTNTVRASVTLDDGTTKTDAASTVVTIGAPESGCPSGWPITSNISQGPEGTDSHAAGKFAPGDPGYEAIDMGTGAVMGFPVYATLSGTINIRQSRQDGIDERVGIIPDNCPGLTEVIFMHMSDIFPNDGDHVAVRQQFGLSGAYVRDTNGDGVPDTPAPHIHYQFNDQGDRSFPIQPPYIPVAVPRTCTGDCNIATTAP